MRYPNLPVLGNDQSMLDTAAAATAFSLHRGGVPSGEPMAVRPLKWGAISAPKSLIPLVALTAIFAVGLSVLAVHDLGASDPTILLYTFEFRLIFTWWVRFDIRARAVSVPFEFDAFVFFAWPIVVPYYLWRSRGLRGLIFGVGIWALYITPDLTARLVHNIALAK